VFKAQDDHVLKVEVFYYKSLGADKCVATHEITLAQLENDVKKDFVLATDDGGQVIVQITLSPAI